MNTYDHSTSGSLLFAFCVLPITIRAEHEQLAPRCRCCALGRANYAPRCCGAGRSPPPLRAALRLRARCGATGGWCRHWYAALVFVRARRPLSPWQALPVAVASDEGLSRSVYFNAHALPALAHYRLTEWWLRRQGASEAETEAALQPLHDRYAPLSLHVILKLRVRASGADRQRQAASRPRARRLARSRSSAQGFYIKLGKIGATRSDFVAPQYIERCETLYVSCERRSLNSSLR